MTLLRPLIVTFALLAAGTAGAQTLETVKIGNQTKNAYGTVTGLQNGDIACYLTLKDDRGGTFKEMGDFELCQQRARILNKRVALKYSLQKVQSADCQGDPDCKKSDTVILVTAATPTQAAASTPAPAAQASSTRNSFCTADEQIVFSCRSGQKMVSVCAPKGATATKGYLDYRFGDPAADKLELELPSSRALPPRVANGGNDGFAGGGGAWMMFRRGEYAYSVYSGIGNWGPNGEKREKAGLLVQRNGKEVAVLRCGGKYWSELGPDINERLGLTKGKIEFFEYPDI